MATSFAELRHELTQYLTQEEVEKISLAYQVAQKAHRDQARSTGEAYITHPLAVAAILAGMRMDADGIMAALLHDVLEDCSVDKTFLVSEFGQEVADLVDGVSKLTQMQFKSREEAQAENFRKMVLALAKDIRVILIKLADRLHNMRTLYALDFDRRIRIAQETLEIYAPIANRLGIYRFRVELEDRAFAVLYPLRSRVLEKVIRRLRGNREKVLQKIENALRHCFEQDEIPVRLYGREKHLYGIYKKMKKKHLSLEEVMDVVAFRIIVDKVDTCYRALGAVHNLYKPVPGRFKDYIAIPKSNGYQSLHTILFGPSGAPIEIQIRTEEMQQLAEHGIAGHWLYKAREMLPRVEVATKGWVRGLLEIQKATGSSLEFIENVKVDLFPDEVYLFTPTGKIMELPRGATVVDFAYAVHTDLGNTCIAAKIDKRLAPLSTRLANGQTVEIITTPGAHPNPSWLNYVVTAKARSSIRHFLKNQQRSESIQLGKRLLEKALQHHPAALPHLSTGLLDRIATEFGFKDAQGLLEDMGLGNRPALLIARRLMARAEGEVFSEDIALAASTPLVIKGTEGMVIHYAKCCHPIPGDPIVGYLSAGRGIVVHVESCKNTASFARKPEKRVQVQWEDVVAGEFPVELKMQLENRKGVLAQVALAISESGSNIDNISTEDLDGQHTLLTIVLSVRDRAHLASIIRKIRRVRSVAKIVRNRL